jgi:hypothetical protein
MLKLKPVSLSLSLSLSVSLFRVDTYEGRDSRFFFRNFRTSYQAAWRHIPEDGNLSCYDLEALIGGWNCGRAEKKIIFLRFFSHYFRLSTGE